MSFTLDLSDVEAQESFNTLPSGKYYLRVEEFEKKVSQAKAKYLKATFVVDKDQKGAGMKVWENFNIEHEIGRQRLRTLAVRCGITKPKFDVLKLKGKRVLCKLGVEKDEEYGDKNKIIQFLSEEAEEETKTTFSDAAEEANEIDDEEIPW